MWYKSGLGQQGKNVYIFEVRIEINYLFREMDVCDKLHLFQHSHKVHIEYAVGVRAILTPNNVKELNCKIEPFLGSQEVQGKFCLMAVTTKLHEKLM